MVFRFVLRYKLVIFAAGIQSFLFKNVTFCKIVK